MKKGSGAPMPLERAGDCRWAIPRHGAMNVPGLVFADDRLMESIRTDDALRQVADVACLPGIVRASMAMPDIHWGYGFPSGVIVRSDGYDTLAEEMPEAYKDVSEVVDVVQRAGLSRKVARLVPLGVIKG